MNEIPVHNRKKTRVQGTASETVIKSGAGILHRVVISDPAGAGAAGTVAVRDGAGAGNDQIVLDVAQGESRSIEFGVPFDTDIRIKNSDTDVDVLVIYS